MLGHVDDSQMEGKPSFRYCRLGKTSVARFGSVLQEVGSVPKRFGSYRNRFFRFHGSNLFGLRNAHCCHETNFEKRMCFFA